MNNLGNSGAYEQEVDAYPVEAFEDEAPTAPTPVAWDEKSARQEAKRIIIAEGIEDPSVEEQIASDLMTNGVSNTAVEIKRKMMQDAKERSIQAAIGLVGEIGPTGALALAQNAAVTVEHPSDIIQERAITRLAANASVRAEDEGLVNPFEGDNLQKVLDKENEISRNVSEQYNTIDPFNKGWIGGIGDFLGLLAPFSDAVSLGKLERDFRKIGHNVDIPLWKLIASGEGKAVVADYWQSLPPAEQEALYPKLAQLVQENAGYFGNNSIIAASILDDAIVNPSVEGFTNHWRVLDNVVGAFEALSAAGTAIKLTKGVMNVTSNAKVAERVDPKQGAEVQAQAIAANIADPTSDEVAAKLGTSTPEIVADKLMTKWSGVQDAPNISYETMNKNIEAAQRLVKGQGADMPNHFHDAEKVRQAEKLQEAMDASSVGKVWENTSRVERTEDGISWTGTYGFDSTRGFSASEVLPAMERLINSVEADQVATRVVRKAYDGTTEVVDVKKLSDSIKAASAPLKEKLSNVTDTLNKAVFKNNAMIDYIRKGVVPANMPDIAKLAERMIKDAQKANPDMPKEQVADLVVKSIQASNKTNRAKIKEIGKTEVNKVLDDTNQYFIETTVKETFKAAKDKVGYEGFINDIFARGKIATYFKDISAGLAKGLSDSFYRAFDKSRQTEKAMYSIMKPFTESSNKAKKITLAILEEGSTFKVTNTDGTTSVGKNFTVSEVIAKLPADIDGKTAQEVVDGYMAVRIVADVSHAAMNKRVRDKLLADGYRHIDLGDFQTAGVKLSDGQAEGIRVYYDPSTNQVMEVSAQDVRRLQAEGYSFYRSREVLGSGDSQTFNLIVKDPHLNVKPLPDEVLRYREGYIPRIYDEQYFITVTPSAKKLDGVQVRPEELPAKTIGVAKSKKEAEALMKELNAKEKDKKNPQTFSWKHSRELMRTDDELLGAEIDLAGNAKGLFYSKRGEHISSMMDGKLADVQDPVQAITKMTSSVSRLMDLTPVIDLHKQRWLAEFGHLTNGKYPKDMSAIRKDTRLTDEELGKAQAYWNYIDLQESNGMTKDWWKAQMFKFGEWMEDKGLEAIGSFFRTKVSNYDPFSITRGLTFTATITLNPVRQIWLQSQQYLFLTGLDPVGIASGRVVATAASLATNMDMSKSKTALKAMGLTKDEYLNLKQAFNESGLKEAVDSHIIGRDAFMTLRAEVTEGAAQAMAQRLGNAVKSTVNTIRQAGFDWGETSNLAHTYVIAYRRFKEANPGVDAFTSKAKYQIAADARQLALGMTQPGAYQYQRNWLSVPLQFLSVQQKAVSTMIQAIPGITGGNKAITKAEARRIAIGQLLLYGATGWGIHNVVDSVLEKYGVQIDPELRLGLIGGVYDYALNALIQHVDDGITNNFAFSSNLAAGSGWADTFVDKLSDFQNTTALEIFAGPSSTMYSRFGNAMAITGTIFGKSIYGEEGMSAEDAAEVVDAWMSIASLYNNVARGWAMHKSGQYVDKHLNRLGLDASNKEALVRAILGVTTHEEIGLHEVAMTSSERQRKLQAIADFHAGQIERILGLTGEHGNMPLNSQRGILKAIDAHNQYLAFAYGEEDARQILLLVQQKIKRDMDKGDRRLMDGVATLSIEGTLGTTNDEVLTTVHNRGLVAPDMIENFKNANKHFFGGE